MSMDPFRPHEKDLPGVLNVLPEVAEDVQPLAVGTYYVDPQGRALVVVPLVAHRVLLVGGQWVTGAGSFPGGCLGVAPHLAHAHILEVVEVHLVVVGKLSAGLVLRVARSARFRIGSLGRLLGRRRRRRRRRPGDLFLPPFRAAVPGHSGIAVVAVALVPGIEAGASA